MEVLPPPPPLPLNSKHHGKSKLVPMTRPGFGRRGQPITLLTNHFKVTVASVDGDFYHYSVALSYDDGSPVDGKGIGRKVIDKLQETYDTELAGKDFAYDGEKSLFTVGPLPQNKLEFTVILEDLSSNKAAVNGSPANESSLEEGGRKRIRRPLQSKSFKVEISFAARIPMRAITNALRGQESENSQEALRVLDIILRQNAAKQGCLLVRKSLFHNRPRNFCDLGGSVLGCRGFHSSFRATQGGLSLNIDVSTTMIIQPGPVIDFLIANQCVRDPHEIDWAKARRMLKNLRINASPSNMEYKITGLSDLPCNQQLFSLEQRTDGNAEGEVQMTEVTVYDYFVNYRNIQLRYSGDLPCINVGKPKRPIYIPLELCSLVSLQRYTKALSTIQRTSLVEKSRQKPQERMSVLSDVLTTNNYSVDALLRAAGVSISSSFPEIEGCVLSAPKLTVGNGEDFCPQNGRWNYNHKKLVQPTKIERWAIVNFSVHCDIKRIWTDLARCGQQKGIYVEDPFVVLEENPQVRRAPPLARVENMFEQIKTKLPQIPRFLLCLLPERKTSTIYGPWKRKTLADFGIVTQCMSPLRVNDQYLSNVLLKINAKLGGLNALLSMEQSPSMPMISKFPTMILGMDVSHGSPGQSDIPSIAAVVGSRQWPLISRYRASVRRQSPKVEMIDYLFKKVSDTVDEGIIRMEASAPPPPFPSNYLQKKMNIFVRNLDGNSIAVLVDRDDCVQVIKEIIEEGIGIPSSLSRLVFQGTELHSSRSLASYNVEKDNTIHLLVRLIGGMQPPSIIQTCKRIREDLSSPEVSREVKRSRRLQARRVKRRILQAHSPQEDEVGISLQHPQILLFGLTSSQPVTLSLDIAGMPYDDLKEWAEKEVGCMLKISCILEAQGSEVPLSKDVWDDLWASNSLVSLSSVIFRPC